MRVKICGITNTEDARAAARCGADFVGLILAPSPRRVTIETARIVAATLPPTTQPVLVFRDAPVDEVVRSLADTACTWVQLHGRESVNYLRQLTSFRPSTHIIKAWEIIGPEVAPRLAEYRRDAATHGLKLEALLLDTPKGGPHPGYEILGQVSQACPARPPEIWCAGGLTPTNVATALAAGVYDGVDVSSGVESTPGNKDQKAVQRFIEVAKRG